MLVLINNHVAITALLSKGHSESCRILYTFACDDVGAIISGRKLASVVAECGCVSVAEWSKVAQAMPGIGWKPPNDANQPLAASVY